MSQQQVQAPVTYGDVFAAAGDIASLPVTKEDASLMQSAESLAMGKTKKHGAASIMQAAADKNLRSGAIAPDTHTIVAEEGVTVLVESTVPGGIDISERVAGQEVLKEMIPVPTDSTIANEDPITIGEALEVAAVGFCDKPVEASDARAIQSAYARATGISCPVKGDIVSTAQSAAELNVRVDDAAKTTIGDILMDASTELVADKVVTQEDARKVREAELRGAKNGDTREAGVISAALQSAADINTEAAKPPANSALLS